MAARSSTPAGTAPRRRSRTTTAASSCWCSRRSSTSSSSSGFESANALIEYAGGLEVRPVQPRVVKRGETARIVLPGDEGYDDMTASLPDDVQAVFDRFITTELTTVTRDGQPITWPVTPYYRPGEPCIDVTTGDRATRRRPTTRGPTRWWRCSSPTRPGAGLAEPPMVLVQGTAEVDDRDLEANRARYERESPRSSRRCAAWQPPDALRRFMAWYYMRIYIHVRPERVYVWPRGDLAAEPTLYDAHMEEVRSGHSRGAAAVSRRPRAAGSAPGTSGSPSSAPATGPRCCRSSPPTASRSQSESRSRSMRPPLDPDRAARRRESRSRPGLACLTAHEHAPEIQLAAQLPGPRRPRARRRRLGADPPPARRRIRDPPHPGAGSSARTPARRGAFTAPRSASWRGRGA